MFLILLFIATGLETQVEEPPRESRVYKIMENGLASVPKSPKKAEQNLLPFVNSLLVYSTRYHGAVQVRPEEGELDGDHFFPTGYQLTTEDGNFKARIYYGFDYRDSWDGNFLGVEIEVTPVDPNEIRELRKIANQAKRPRFLRRFRVP